MKKVVRIVQKEETINICDVCSAELPYGAFSIDIRWQKRCPSDDCYSDWGSLNFCSFACTTEGIKKLTEHIEHDEDFYYQSFEISASSTAQDPDILPNILKLITPNNGERK